MYLVSSLFTIITTEIKQVVLQIQKLLVLKNLLTGIEQNYLLLHLVGGFLLFYWGVGKDGTLLNINSLMILLPELKTTSLSAFNVDKIKDIMEKLNIPCKYRLSEFDLWRCLCISKSNLMNINPVCRLKKEQKCCK